MEEKKLTDEEIVKALECCAVEPCEDCGNCPRFTKEKLCHKANAKQSLDLIHRLQDENETQRKIIEYQDGLPDLVEQQKAEIERMTEELRLKTKEFELTEKALIKNVSENVELQSQVDNLTEELDISDDRIARLNLAIEGLTCENKVLHQENDELIKQVDELTEQRDKQAYIAEDLIQEKHRWTEQAVKDTAKEIFEKLLGFMGSKQKFVIVNDDNKTLIDCDELFGFVGQLAKEQGVEVE